MAAASLVLGILSIVCGVFGMGLRVGGAILAVIGMILGAKNKDEDKSSMAKAGRTCSLVGLILCVVLFSVSMICAKIFYTTVGSELLKEMADWIGTYTAQ